MQAGLGEAACLRHDTVQVRERRRARFTKDWFIDTQDVVAAGFCFCNRTGHGVTPAANDGRYGARQARISGLLAFQAFRHVLPQRVVRRPTMDSRRSVRTAAEPRSASAKVVESPTVGPEAITLKSSPTTSEMAKVRRGPCSKRSQPSALHTRDVLSNRIERVDIRTAFRSRDVVWRLSSRVIPSAGTAIIAEAPPDNKTSSNCPSGSDAQQMSAHVGPPARFPPSALDGFPEWIRIPAA